MRNEIKKMFNQIEYPVDKIGTVFFAIVSKNKDVQIRTALIQKGDTDSTVDEIFDDYSTNYDILFKPKDIHTSVIEALKANREVPVDLIYDVYMGTDNQEYKKFIEAGEYLENVEALSTI